MSESLDFLKRELERWSGVEYGVEDVRPHPKLRIEYAGARRFLPFSSTRVDRRGLLNKVTELRRMLRDMGAERDRG